MVDYWHILKSGKFDDARIQSIWDEERSGSFISAGYGNEPDGKGFDKLSKYEIGDRAFIYVPGRGAVGVGVVRSAGATFVAQESRDDHAHRRQLEWLHVIPRIVDAVPMEAIRERCRVAHPRTLSVKIQARGGDRLAALIKQASV